MTAGLYSSSNPYASQAAVAYRVPLARLILRVGRRLVLAVLRGPLADLRGASDTRAGATKSLALAIDAAAESSSPRTFFSTLLSMDESSSSTSESNASIFVSIVIGFVDFLFDFMRALRVATRGHFSHSSLALPRSRIDISWDRRVQAEARASMKEIRSSSYAPNEVGKWQVVAAEDWQPRAKASPQPGSLSSPASTNAHVPSAIALPEALPKSRKLPACRLVTHCFGRYLWAQGRDNHARQQIPIAHQAAAGNVPASPCNSCKQRTVASEAGVIAKRAVLVHITVISAIAAALCGTRLLKRSCEQACPPRSAQRALGFFSRRSRSALFRRALIANAALVGLYAPARPDAGRHRHRASRVSERR